MENPLIANGAEVFRKLQICPKTGVASVKNMYISRIAFSEADNLEQYFMGLA
jgi:hypothetical protein